MQAVFDTVQMPRYPQSLTACAALRAIPEHIRRAKALRTGAA